MIQDSRFGFSGRTLHTEYSRTASNWQSSYAFYLQGFSYAHVEAYQQHKATKQHEK